MTSSSSSPSSSSDAAAAALQTPTTTTQPPPPPPPRPPSQCSFQKVMVANRGEIAIRVMRTCRVMGIGTVAVYSDADRHSTHVKFADEAVCIGAAPALASYLNIENIVRAAAQMRVDAIHPGYGFLSENPEFARAVERAGMVFIGPSADTMHQLGNKKAVKIMLSAHRQVPMVPGYNGERQDADVLAREAVRVGFPVLIKAAAGGGGKGMRIVNNAGEFANALTSVKAEACNSFGSDEVLLERYFVSVRHTEVQIFGDKHGNVVHYGERDCSMQRRYQKVIEEAPSPVVSSALRARLGEAATTIGRLAQYVGAGTVEFLLDGDEHFYFLEVNTRLQVEHPVTELIHEMDFVQLQIEIAQGASLRELRQLPEQRAVVSASAPRHAIECRLYAEDPVHFYPCTGLLRRLHLAEGVGVRYDVGVETGSLISVHYDPMVAKVICYGASRALAIQRMLRALQHTVVLGVSTNQPFLLHLLRTAAFQSGEFDTRYIDLRLPLAVRARLFDVGEADACRLALLACVWDVKLRQGRQRHLRHILPTWSNNMKRPLRKAVFRVDPPSSEAHFHVAVYYRLTRHDTFHMRVHVVDNIDDASTVAPDAATAHAVVVVAYHGVDGVLDVEVDERMHHARVAHRSDLWRDGDDDELIMFVHETSMGGAMTVTRLSRFALANRVELPTGQVTVLAPLPCRILELPVTNGGLVVRGEVLAVVESMKMEQKVLAEVDGRVEVLVKVGQVVEAKAPLLHVMPVTNDT